MKQVHKRSHKTPQNLHTRKEPADGTDTKLKYTTNSSRRLWWDTGERNDRQMRHEGDMFEFKTERPKHCMIHRETWGQLPVKSKYLPRNLCFSFYLDQWTMCMRIKTFLRNAEVLVIRFFYWLELFSTPQRSAHSQSDWRWTKVS